MVDKAIESLARKAWEHAGGCKKSPDDCATCQKNIAWFGQLSLPVLSEVLGEKPKVGASV